MTTKPKPKSKPTTSKYEKLLEQITALRTCGDCGAKPGELHQEGCHNDQCPVCGGQRMCCDCELGKLQRIPWTGMASRTKDAIRLGFWCRSEKPSGFGPYVTCHPTHPDARPDLNTVARECVWNMERQRFELRCGEA